MTTSREMVLIGGLVRSLRHRDSWAGETHIQKAAYLAKVLRGVPFASEFVLYKHGPYSFDLSKSLVHMLGRNVLATTTNHGYGPSFNVNFPLWSAINTAAGDFYSNFSSSVDEICDAVAKKNVAELERIATAVYLNLSLPGSSVEERAIELSKIKPHIPPELARAAFDEAALLPMGHQD